MGTTDDSGPAGAVTRRQLLKPSASSVRFAEGERPLTRGWSHLLAAVVALPASVWWATVVPGGRARLGVMVFGLGAGLMFAASALLHVRRWSRAMCERLVRIDHTGIYLAIGGTGLAVGTLGLRGWAQTALVTVVAVGTVLGIAVEWLPFAPPRGFSNGVYLSLGWSPIVLLPWLWSASGPRTVALLLAGGVLYTVGAIVVGLRRPRLVPRVFGYHELFHVLVIAAVAVHAWMVADLASRQG